jgi:hypothetical protein
MKVPLDRFVGVLIETVASLINKRLQMSGIGRIHGDSRRASRVNTMVRPRRSSIDYKPSKIAGRPRRGNR